MAPAGPVAVTSGPRNRRADLFRAAIHLVAGPESGGAGWLDATVKALSTGLVGIVQCRDKTCDDAAFLAAAARLRALCDSHGGLLILNDRVHLVGEARADGVHVGEGDASPAEARSLLGPDLLVGLSTHDEAEVLVAGTLPVDYVGLGPCHGTSSRRLSRTPGGPDLVRRCAPLAGSLPFFPIGGITVENAAALVKAGARRLAVGAGILGARDPAGAVRALASLLPNRASGRGRGRHGC